MRRKNKTEKKPKQKQQQQSKKKKDVGRCSTLPKAVLGCLIARATIGDETVQTFFKKVEKWKLLNCRDEKHSKEKVKGLNSICIVFSNEH